MKHILLLIIFLSGCFPNLLIAGELDSLMTERKKLSRNYNELMSTSRTTPDTDRQIFYNQRKIIEIDNIIFENYFDDLLTFKNVFEAEKTEILGKLEKVEKERSFLSNVVLFGAIGSGVLLILFIVMIVVAVNKSNKNNKSEKKLGEVNLLLESYKNDVVNLKNEIQTKENQFNEIVNENRELSESMNEYKEKFDEIDKRGGKMHVETIRVKNENSKLKEEISQLQNELKISRDNEQKDMTDDYKTGEEFQNLEIKLNEAKQSLDELTNHNKSISEELQKVMIQNNDLVDENEKLKQEVLDKKADLEQLISEKKQAEQKEKDRQEAEKREKELRETQQIEAEKREKELRETLQIKEAEPKEVEQKEKKIIKTEPKEKDPEIEYLMEENLKLQNEINELKILLDEELETRQTLYEDFKELEEFYKVSHIEKRKVDETISKEQDLAPSEDTEHLEKELQTTKDQLQQYQIQLKEEEQARIELENELQSILNNFKQAKEDFNLR